MGGTPQNSKDAELAAKRDRQRRAIAEAIVEATDNHTEAQNTYLSALEANNKNPEDEDIREALQKSRKELNEASNDLLKLTNEE